MQRLAISIAAAALALTACADVPQEATTLSNTVGRDLEEIHRAHRALAVEYFDLVEQRVNRFVDEEYKPAFVRRFAEEFELDEKVRGIVASNPENLLPVLERFVATAITRIENKRRELLEPLEAQRREVITEIDDAHRQVSAAHAVVTGHLASIRDVHEVQSEILGEVGLGDLRQRIAARTANLSNEVADLIERGEAAQGRFDELEEILNQLRDTLSEPV